MVIALLLILVVVAVVVLVVRKARPRTLEGGGEAHAVRRFFQYLVLYGLLVVLSVGLSGLLGRLFERQVVVSADAADLARNLAFTVVGIPLYVGLALWTRRRFAENPGEPRSLGWAFYVTAASLTSLVVAMTGLGQVLAWAVGLEDFTGSGLATFIVWGGAWGAHFWVDARVTPTRHSLAHHLAGSLIGLVTAAVGLAGLLSGALRLLLGFDADVILADHGSPLLSGLVTLLVGAPVWVLYWTRTSSRYEGDPFWLAYVLLVGVGGGLVTAVASASTLAYSVLVWFLGEPRSPLAVEHFAGAPTSAAAAVVGGLVWWYHQALLKRAGAGERTEVRRIYEYLMAGIGLLAAAGGLTTAFVALLEALTGTARLFVGASAVNTLLAAATLLAVGGPVWWVYWRRIQHEAHAHPGEELGSPTRRVYLFGLFGVGGVAAVIALLVGVYLLFEDVVNGTVGAETLRRMRFAVGVLLTTAALASYHWAVYRADRERMPSAAGGRGPRFVLLVGPADHEIARTVARHTHGRVQAWTRTDDGLGTWSVDEVVAALEKTTADEVIVLAGPGGPRAIPVHRR